MACQALLTKNVRDRDKFGIRNVAPLGAIDLRQDVGGPTAAASGLHCVQRGSARYMVRTAELARGAIQNRLDAQEPPAGEDA
jgi:hypothetical protein